MSVVRTAKQQLRSHIKAELAKISSDSIDLQSNSVCQTIIKFSKFQNAKKIGIYMSMPQEIQTLKIIEYCFKNDKQVYLPQCIYESTFNRKKFHLKLLKVNSFKEILQLKPQGKFQLLEPTEGEDIMGNGGLDLLIVPGVAFNHQCKRLGHGAGFYDEFLSTYNGKYRKPYILGIGLKEQLIEQIPTENHDWTLDGIIIDDMEPIEEVYSNR